MEWLLGGPSAGWLVDDPERDFGDEELLAPPPPPASPPTMYYCMRHGFGPCLPSPTPSDEDMQHFAPPGYEPVPVPEFSSSSAAALVDAHPPLVKKEEVVAAAPARSPRALPVPDLNLPAPEKEEDEPVPQLPTPSLEARVILRGWSLPPPLMELPVAVARGHSHGAGERWKKKMLELGVIHSSIPF
jgi:hypothetical protein